MGANVYVISKDGVPMAAVDGDLSVAMNVPPESEHRWEPDRAAGGQCRRWTRADGTEIRTVPLTRVWPAAGLPPSSYHRSRGAAVDMLLPPSQFDLIRTTAAPTLSSSRVGNPMEAIRTAAALAHDLPIPAQIRIDSVATLTRLAKVLGIELVQQGVGRGRIPDYLFGVPIVPDPGLPPGTLRIGERVFFFIGDSLYCYDMGRATALGKALLGLPVTTEPG